MWIWTMFKKNNNYKNKLSKNLSFVTVIYIYDYNDYIYMIIPEVIFM